jgi:hypothetical protein
VTSRRAGRIAIVAWAAASAACIFHGPEDLRRDLARTAGVDLDRESGITLGRMSLAIARLATDGDEVPLQGLRKVEVGVYEVSARDDEDADRAPIVLPEPPGWQTVVRLHQEGEDVIVLVEPREEGIRRLLIVVADEQEWILVRVRGRIEGMLEQAMQAAFDGADRPDLYEPVVAEYHAKQAGSES